MKALPIKQTLLGAASALTSLGIANAQDPSVVVTIENMSPYNGTFLTPVWVGFHNGEFDSYDGGKPANALPIEGSDALERLAEDGSTGPISADFAQLVPQGTQGTIASNGPIPPIGPSQTVSRLFDVSPELARYFSYVSMVIPSNDAFIANGSPVAHPVFNEGGEFVGGSFYIKGSSVNDAATEVNDEVPANTAFFGQMAPNTGVDENGVIFDHTGFNDASLGGILADGMFREGDFLQDGANIARVTLTYLNKSNPVLFSADLGTTFESPAPTVEGDPNGRAFFLLDDDGESLIYFVFTNGLSGNITASHLHLAPLTQNGPVVLPLQVFAGRFAFGRINASEVVGPLAGTDSPLDSLIAEITAGTSYVNVHTAANPAGELRGQVHPASFQ